MSLRDHVVLLRAVEAVSLDESELFEVRTKDASIQFRPLHVGKLSGISLPIGLGVEAIVSSASLASAMESAVSIVNAVLNHVSFLTNAFAGSAEVLAGYESLERNGRREFRQNSVDPLPSLPRQLRRTDGSLVIALLEQTLDHPERKRVARAMSHYVRALETWSTAGAMESCSHLFMAVEALGPAVLSRFKGDSKSDIQAAADWGMDTSSDEWRKKFTNVARCQLIFEGDTNSYIRLKNARDAYLHSFDTFATVREIVSSPEDRRFWASCIRRSILDLLDIQPAHRELLLGERYTDPLSREPLIRQLEGWVVANGLAVGRFGDPHLRLGQRSEFLDASMQGGRISLTIRETWSHEPSLDAAQFAIEAIGLYGDADTSPANVYALDRIN